jgi:hypothetical protein
MDWVVFQYGDTSWVLEGWFFVGFAACLLLWVLSRVKKTLRPGDITVSYPLSITEEHFGKVLKADRVWEELDGYLYQCSILSCPARFSLYGFKAHLDEAHRDYGRVTWIDLPGDKAGGT